MSKSARQKLKLFYMKDYLLSNTDESHTVTVKDIISYLEKSGITAERKSIYSDIEVLCECGLDIVSEKKGYSVGYKVVSRDFEISELKLLVDAVQSSRFITQKKSAELTKKLEMLCSKFEAYEFDRQMIAVNRIKSMNESIYYNIDKIQSAIKNNVKITYKYFDYNSKKEKVYRHDGEYYTVSPFSLTWDDENYYLIAYDEKRQSIRHYRVDKMDTISEKENEKRNGLEAFNEIDVSAYSKKVFSMFGGDTVKIKLEFSENLAGVVIDRFGKDTFFSDSPHKGFFTFETEIVVSPQFFGWLFSFGDSAKILYPENIANDFKNCAKSIYEIY